jgi:hypothetical protein
MKEERMKTFACSPQAKQVRNTSKQENVSVSGYSIKIARPIHSRNKGELNALSQEFNLNEGFKLHDSRRKVNLTKQS